MKDYVGMTRRYHPQGWSEPFWAAVIFRPGASRATFICRCQHDSKEAAQRCADHLAAVRNTKVPRAKGTP